MKSFYLIITYILIGVFISLVFLSCSKSTDAASEEKTIIGTWELVGTSSFTTTITKGSTGIVILTNVYDCPYNNESSYSCIYTMNSGNLTMTTKINVTLINENLISIKENVTIKQTGIKDKLIANYYSGTRK